MIYLDNAATTFHKPKSVLRALGKNYANAGRGGHKLAFKASMKIMDCRETLADFFGVLDPSRIAFTYNTTEALNCAIKGAVGEGDHIIISGMEHNSVARPAYASKADVSIAEADQNGLVGKESVQAQIRPNTKLIAITHASNICGTINPIAEIGEIARDNGILFLVDSAQTAGVCPINVLDQHIDLLAFAGHKMLFGPQGTGGLYVREGVDLKPLKQGGTGSMSEDMVHPTFMPDLLESGTLNTSGIDALREGVRFIKKIGLEKIKEHEQKLTKRLIEGLKNIPNVTVYGSNNPQEQVGVVGFNVQDKDCVELCNILSMRYNIALRAGMHCAALAHESMGTKNLGMARASVSWFTKPREINRFLDSLWHETKN